MKNRDNVISIAKGMGGSNLPFWKFRYPHQVLADATLEFDDKRAILAAWASDEHAVESLPTMRHLPGTPFPVTFSSIMHARLALDKMSGANDDDPQPPPLSSISRRPTLSTAA
jgi:hypothetical protein